MSLTPRQLEVVNMIRAHRSLHGVSPTYQEIADAMSMSKTAVAEHIRSCIAKGVLRIDARKRRSIEPVDEELIARHDAVTAVETAVPEDVRGRAVEAINQIPARR